MSQIHEQSPFTLRALNTILQKRAGIEVCPFGVFTSSDAGISVIAQRDGGRNPLVDKPRDGIMNQPNIFAGGDRSAFCPTDAPVWQFREVVRRHFGDRKAGSFHASITASAAEVINAELPAEQTDVEVTNFSTEVVFAIAHREMFGMEIPVEKRTAIVKAYNIFNDWCGTATATKGFADMGRSPRLSYTSLLDTQQPEEEAEQGFLAKVSGVVFGAKQQAFNESLTVIADHADEVWKHIKQNDTGLARSYQEKAAELGLTEVDIKLELTNIIGGAISNPSAFLAFSLATYGRLNEEEKAKIRVDETYRSAFYHEVQRFFQPMPWIMRDIVSDIELENGTYDKGNYVFFTYGYNRRTDIWGDDADEFNPDRFIENPELTRSQMFFSKGRRRCPAGRFGEAISVASFEHMINNYAIKASGDVEIKLGGTITPKGTLETAKLEQ